MASQPFLFENQFLVSMTKLGNVQVLTRNEGEVRVNCNYVNGVEGFINLWLVQISLSMTSKWLVFKYIHTRISYDQVRIGIWKAVIMLQCMEGFKHLGASLLGDDLNHSFVV
ncbi:uncharacterized protein LOC121243048 [Juglans microcarpa x Juglans regia]|uniref:uncharacterized protein LOC121243048 n=1 Tax=Juglans microcarpa x Juglans regia TaxID=2249226 RepID=UPI001B7F4FA6|nr:uncharacterized protein LOC121243048 [Juglans microcarpa x Juglans regia]